MKSKLVTPVSITADQVLELFIEGLVDDDTAHEATADGVWPHERRAARVRCAAAYNASRVERQGRAE